MASDANASFPTSVLAGLRYHDAAEEDRAKAFLRKFFPVVVAVGEGGGGCGSGDAAAGQQHDLHQLREQQDEALAYFCVVRREWLLHLLRAFPKRRLAVCFRIAGLPPSATNASVGGQFGVGDGGFGQQQQQQQAWLSSFGARPDITELMAPSQTDANSGNGDGAIPLQELCLHALATAATVYSHTTAALRSVGRSVGGLAVHGAIYLAVQERVELWRMLCSACALRTANLLG